MVIVSQDLTHAFGNAITSGAVRLIKAQIVNGTGIKDGRGGWRDRWGEGDEGRTGVEGEENVMEIRMLVLSYKYLLLFYCRRNSSD